MNKVVEFLNANPVQYLATVGRDGKAKCRPFMFAGELDGKLWFCTNNTKDVYKDMISVTLSETVTSIYCFHAGASSISRLDSHLRINSLSCSGFALSASNIATKYF